MIIKIKMIPIIDTLSKSLLECGTPEWSERFGIYSLL